MKKTKTKRNMKNPLRFLLTLALGLVVAGCGKEYDDSALKNKMNDLEAQLKRQAEQVATYQSQVAALKAVVDAMEKGDYVTSVQEIEGGVTITFAKKGVVTILNGVDGKDGDNLFSKVVDGEESVDFYLADGSVISIPKAEAFELQIPKVYVYEGDQASIPYTVKNATKNTTVDVFAGGLLEAAVQAKDYASGTIEVKIPDAAEGQILAWADNGAGKTSLKKISLEDKIFTVGSVEEVPAVGATVEVKVVSNLAYKVVPVADWITYVETRAATESTIVLQVAANPGDLRTGDVKILRADNDQLLQTISIAQKAVVKVARLEKVFGLYGKAGRAGWAGLVSGIEDLDGNVRNACFDDEFVYVPKAKGVDANGDGNFDEVKVFKFKISDGSYAGLVQRTVDPDYMAGTWASTFPVSCVRVMKNTDPAVNGGKDVLVACNLSDGQRVRVYAWENGVDRQPKLLTDIADSRRLGDKISVEGTYQDGRIWFRSFDNNGTVYFVNLVPGYTSGFEGSHAWNWLEALGKISVGDVNNVSEFCSFNKGAYSLIATNSEVGTHLVRGTSEMKRYPDLARCFGWSAFKFKDKDYLAYLSLAGGADKPVIRVLEGASNTAAALQATLDAHVVAFEAAFATADMSDMETGTTPATEGVGDCQVRFIDGVPYVLGVTSGSMALFRIVER